MARCSSATRTPLRGGALGIALLAASFALLALPACNECDSSIDPVKCTDLCTQSPPHEDCAQCQGDSLAADCPQCLADSNAPGCPDAGSSGSAGTDSGSGGSGGNAGTVSGSGGVGGVVSGGDGGMSGGLGGIAGSDLDAGPPPSCERDNECTEAARPLCSGGECAVCESNAVCEMHHDPLVLCSAAGACVECRDDDDCEAATPECVGGLCKECEFHAECDNDIDRPQCSSEHSCVPCTEAGNACSEHDPREICDDREPATDTVGQCVQCLGHGDCPSDTPQCDATGTCVKCDGTLGDDPCIGRMDGDISIATCSLRADVSTFGECVQCTGDTLTDPASSACVVNTSAYSCNQQIGRCTTRPVNSRARCRSCNADSECNMGGKCVEHSIQSRTLGTFCFYPTTGQCAGSGNPGENPFSVALMGESIDLHDSKYCLPPTTCDAYLDAVNVTECGATVSCGLPDVIDGICTDVGAANDQCTYSCDDAYECPDRLPVCDAIGGFCRLE